MFYKYLILPIFQIFLFVNIHCQIPQEDEMLIRISKEAWLGGVIHTNGLGINYTNAKFKTYKKKSLLNIDLININHDKEYKIFGSFDENAKKFVYGKLNSIYSLRVGIGSRKIAFEKLRQNGVQIAINYSYGTSIGLIKPIFLEVFKYDYSGRIAGISLERYDPEQHGFFNIYGRGSWFAGLMNTKINPGAYFKFGMEFEFSTTREIINSLELGITADAFMNPIIIMVDNQSHRFFPSIYLSCSIGNKFY